MIDYLTVFLDWEGENLIMDMILPLIGWTGLIIVPIVVTYLMEKHK